MTTLSCVWYTALSEYKTICLTMFLNLASKVYNSIRTVPIPMLQLMVGDKGV